MTKIRFVSEASLAARIDAEVPTATTSRTGRVELATNTETTAGIDSTRAVTPAGLQAFKDALVNAAPGTLDQLNEVATALGNDPNFATTIMGLLGGKIPTTQKGAASGVAPLGTDSKVPDANLPQRLHADDLAAAAVSTYQPTAPNIGIRSDAFILRSSDDGDQTAALTAFLADTNLAGKRRIIGYAELTDAVPVPAGAWVDASLGTIKQTGTGKAALNIVGDDVRIIGLELLGRHAAATAWDAEYGIKAQGASAASPLRNLHLEDCSAHLIGKYGMWLKWVEGLRIYGNDLTDLGYAGVMGVSVLDFDITGNLIDTVLAHADFDLNGYGIALTRGASNSLITDPRSARGSVTANRVRNIPWEGIDTHGGEDILIEANPIRNCRTAIAVVPSNNGASVSTFAPLNVNVVGNNCDSGVDDGSASNGIIFAGAAGTLGSSTQHATGSVVGNTSKRYGAKATGTSGGYYINDTAGLDVTGNTAEQCSPHGFLIQNDNYGIALVGNTGIDQWSDTVSNPSLIRIPSGYVTGTIAGNAHRDEGTRAAATHKNAEGISIGSNAGVSIETAANSLDSCALPISGGTGVVRATSHFEHIFKRIAKFANGSAAAPSVTFVQDPDTGFYSIANGDMGLAVNGVQQLDYGDGYVIHRDGLNIVFGTGAGSLLGSGTAQVFGFWGGPKGAQPAAVADATDAATAITQLNALLSRLRSRGIIAT